MRRQNTGITGTRKLPPNVAAALCLGHVALVTPIASGLPELSPSHPPRNAPHRRQQNVALEPAPDRHTPYPNCKLLASTS